MLNVKAKCTLSLLAYNRLKADDVNLGENHMKLHFHGAARTVTGSKHLVEVNGKRILLDCGLFLFGSQWGERHSCKL